MCEKMEVLDLEHELCYLESEVENIKKFCGECQKAGGEKGYADHMWKFRRCNRNDCNMQT